MMLIAGAWFFCVTQSDSVGYGRSAVYKAILFVTGGIAFINGLCDGDNAQ